MGSERVHQDNSVRNYAVNKDASQNEAKKHSFGVPNTNSSLPKEIPAYSRTTHDLISAKILKAAAAKVETQTSPEVQKSPLEPPEKSTQEAKHQSQSESGAAEENPNSPDGGNIQAKLTIGSPGDKYEQEADNMAQRVMSMDAPTANPQIIQPSSELVQKTEANTTTPTAPDLESRLTSKKGGGTPLDEQTRSFMEPRFGADFSSVRVHTDTTAVQMNKELGAQAFAHGKDIFYGQGKNPGNNELTAHELTHVLQQGGAVRMQPKKLVNHQVATNFNKEKNQINKIESIQSKQLLNHNISAASNKELNRFTEATQPLQAKRINSSNLLIDNHESPLQLKNFQAKSISAKKITPTTTSTPENVIQRQPEISSVSPRIQGNFLAEKAFTGVLNTLGGHGAQIMSVLKRAGGVLGSIITNPIQFIGNLIGAIRSGFNKFRANIGTHLKNGLAGWLFGALSGAGLSLPGQFDAKGILSIILQVLNLTYGVLREKIAKKVGHQKVSRLEKSIDILRNIASGGLITAWQQITEFAGNLPGMVMGAIRGWVINKIITAAITKLISMFNPAGAFFEAVKAIYNTIMFFIERASQIAALADAVFASIGKIAAGNIGAAASYVEQSMARTLPVMISFLARLLGLGGISQQIKNVIQRIQAPVSKAIDKLVDVIVAKGQALLGGGQGQKSQPRQVATIPQKPNQVSTTNKSAGNASIPPKKSNKVSTNKPTKSEHDQKVKVGLAQIDQEETKYLDKGKISKVNAEKVANKVKKDNPIFKAINVIDGGKTWDYKWVASDGIKKGEPKAELTARDIAPTDARKVLLLGEGDFSFALSLAKQVKPEQGKRIIATSYDSEHKVKEKYKGASENINALKNQDVTVLYEVDATKDLTQGPFSSIVFNFPFVPGDRRTAVKRNVDMLKKFFKSAANSLCKDGKVFLTSKEYWLKRFKPVDLAASAGLSKDGECIFNAENFPGYEHRESHEDKPAKDTQAAITYIFKKD
jgi:hypothetical protein